ncbi:hypothetical protein FA13DRAFT_1716014 [Coprinellus micaceus]|uniref:Uncharacterized protein n=1 Tax=Coprinellus micaceus TaxID=71717 RepID=A0A4Y7SL85_COPMI|nr:hypothetical protein FA13DRAFT_1716014 [Coprinellus micaceus]
MRPHHDTLVFLLAYSGPVTTRLNASFTNEEHDALDGELLRTPTAPEEPYPFPEGPVEVPLQSQECLPPLPPELREVLPQTPRPEGWQRPKPRPVGTSPPKSAPKATFLHTSSPIFDILAPLEEYSCPAGSGGTPVTGTTTSTNANLPPAVERHKRKHQSQASDGHNFNQDGPKEQVPESEGTKGNTTRTLRARGPAGTVLPRQNGDSTHVNPPAKKRKLAGAP